MPKITIPYNQTNSDRCRPRRLRCRNQAWHPSWWLDTEGQNDWGRPTIG